MYHQDRTGVQIFYQEGTVAVRHEFAVGIAYQRSVTGSDQKFHIGKRLFLIIIRDFGDQ